jgi:dTDP-D-glucose 4,6-dehydratase
MSKIVRLTESDLKRIVSRVINEQEVMDWMQYSVAAEKNRKGMRIANTANNGADGVGFDLKQWSQDLGWINDRSGKDYTYSCKTGQIVDDSNQPISSMVVSQLSLNHPNWKGTLKSDC